MAEVWFVFVVVFVLIGVVSITVVIVDNRVDKLKREIEDLERRLDD